MGFMSLPYPVAAMNWSPGTLWAEGRIGNRSLGSQTVVGSLVVIRISSGLGRVFYAELGLLLRFRALRTLWNRFLEILMESFLPHLVVGTRSFGRPATTRG
jgi:hypothetical protein